jgi:hypothetical protein
MFGFQGRKIWPSSISIPQRVCLRGVNAAQRQKKMNINYIFILTRSVKYEEPLYNAIANEVFVEKNRLRITGIRKLPSKPIDGFCQSGYAGLLVCKVKRKQ